MTRAVPWASNVTAVNDDSYAYIPQQTAVRTKEDVRPLETAVDVMQHSHHPRRTPLQGLATSLIVCGGVFSRYLCALSGLGCGAAHAPMFSKTPLLSPAAPYVARCRGRSRRASCGAIASHCGVVYYAPSRQHDNLESEIKIELRHADLLLFIAQALGHALGPAVHVRPLRHATLRTLGITESSHF